MRFNRNTQWLISLVMVTIIALAGCTANTSTPAPTADARLALIKIIATQTRFIGGDISVAGTLQNDDRDGHDITLRADFLDPGGQPIGNAEGVAEDVGAGQAASFEIRGKVDAARFGNAQVTVISLSERK